MVRALQVVLSQVGSRLGRSPFPDERGWLAAVPKWSFVGLILETVIDNCFFFETPIEPGNVDLRCQPHGKRVPTTGSIRASEVTSVTNEVSKWPAAHVSCRPGFWIGQPFMTRSSSAPKTALSWQHSQR